MTNVDDKSSTIVHFTFVISETEQRELHLDVDRLQSREDEMGRTAAKLGVTPDKWNGSFLYQEYCSGQHHHHHHRPKDNHKKKNASSTTRSTSSRRHRLRFDCTGKTWLTEETMAWLGRYYETGTLLIPSDAHGYSVLATLEYFAILYSPDQCHFQDYNVYERVQLWARYLSHRDALTESVMQSIATSTNSTTSNSSPTMGEQRETVYLGVTPSHHESMELGNNGRISALGGAEYANLAFRLFSQQRKDGQEGTAKELRGDFCQHMACELLPTTKVTFPIKPVTLHSPIQVVNRPVLTIVRQRPDPRVSSRQNKKKLIFMLPDELEVPGIAQPVIQTTTMADENTVTSGLTGPFGAGPTTGPNVMDLLDHEEAKRHEWVQTALMNRGITERMERLLHPEEEPESAAKPTTTNPWEWFTGLGVCEMSRSVVERMGSYMQPSEPNGTTRIALTRPVLVVHPHNNNNKMPPPPPPASSPASRNPSRIQDRLKELTSTVVTTTTNAELLLDRKDCDSSKESPRGVADYHMVDPSTTTDFVRIPTVILEDPPPPLFLPTNNLPMVVSPTSTPPNRNKKRLLGLFRRRKEDVVSLHNE